MTAPRLTDSLREVNLETWTSAVEHRFVRELGSGQVADSVMTRYLVQDHRFLDAFVALLESERVATPDLAPTSGFIDLMRAEA